MGRCLRVGEHGDVAGSAIVKANYGMASTDLRSPLYLKAVFDHFG